MSVQLWNSYIVLQKTRGAARSIKQNLGAWYAVKYLSTQAVEVTSGFNGSSIISSNKKAAVPHKAIHEMCPKLGKKAKSIHLFFKGEGGTKVSFFGLCSKMQIIPLQNLNMKAALPH